jgi:ABC-type sugar transport system permease subunit
MDNRQFMQQIQQQQRARRQAAGAAWMQEQRRQRELEAARFNERQAAGQDSDQSTGLTGGGWQPPAHATPVVAAEQRASHLGKPAPKLRGRVKVEGEVRGLQQRMESKGNRGIYVWSFRLERYNRAGNRLLPIPIEMRGESFQGFLSEGDHVQVRGRARNGVVQARKVHNLTTGARIKIDDRPLLLKILVCPISWFFWAVWWLLCVAFAVGIVVLVIGLVLALLSGG